ncbi:MAG TPA: class I SAM-dependent methyltransferase [Tepidisphaeraceae bacterium]|jgi:SAM-dependent methyltransferase
MVELQVEFDPPARRCIVCNGQIVPWKTKHAHGLAFGYDRCTACSFVFVNPRPTFRSLGRFYADYARTFGLIPAEPGRIVPPVPGQAQRQLIRMMLRVRPGPGTFLDVGSGDGQASAAARDAGLDVTALEIEPRFVASMRLLPGLVVVPQLYEDFQSPPNRFDHILMSHVLEHAHDPAGFVERAGRLLTPGGVLWVLLPSFDSVYRVLLGTRDPYFTPPVHLNHFNPRSLGALCRRAGLEIVENTDYHDIPRDVITKRLPAAMRPPVEAATAVAAALGTWLVTLVGAGAFVRCVARKPA